MATIYKAYIQQLNYDGKNYTAGTFKDIMEAYKCGVVSFPFKPFGEAKDVVTRDWLDEDGLDFYIPEYPKLKAYDMEVEFIFKGTEANIKNNMSNFIKFIHGKLNGSGRLMIYDEFVGIGRKDVRVKSTDNQVFFVSNGSESVATLKVKFEVNDPVTDVTTVGNPVTSLSFSGLKLA